MGDETKHYARWRNLQKHLTENFREENFKAYELNLGYSSLCWHSGNPEGISVSLDMEVYPDKFCLEILTDLNEKLESYMKDCGVSYETEIVRFDSDICPYGENDAFMKWELEIHVSDMKRHKEDLTYIESLLNKYGEYKGKPVVIDRCALDE